MTFPAQPLRRPVRALMLAVLTALAVPLALAGGAALPTRAIVLGIVMGVLVGGVARTGLWLAGGPIGAERANSLAVTSGFVAGVAMEVLGAVAVLAGPVVLAAIPILTGGGVLTWWVRREPRGLA
ncbi:hypothetical protein [Pseudonocardia phyllosphaerae]|uniref:hypothetical protein n=1 Tax=Pseudonocardia phyllosphaerae TaxID=3390502 RepID=UPI003979EF31